MTTPCSLQEKGLALLGPKGQRQAGPGGSRGRPAQAHHAVEGPGLPPPWQDKAGQGRTRQGEQALPQARPGAPKLEHTEKPHPRPQQTLLRQLAMKPARPSGLRPEGVAILSLHGIVNEEQEGSKHHEQEQLAPEWDLAVLAQTSPRGLLFWPNGTAGEPQRGGR